MVQLDSLQRGLLSVQAYRDLDQPVILASGQLGIFYINTERHLEDDGEWRKFGDDSQAMIRHAISRRESEAFNNVISALVSKARELLPEEGLVAISGGQRRDWIFSGPVAAELGLPHVSLYKDDDRGEIISPDGGKDEKTNLVGYHVLHVSDLLTEGSSAYRADAGVEKGWTPMLRKRHATVTNLVTVVSRLQGGEENLAAQDVEVHSLVSIDRDFLMGFSASPTRAVDYITPNPIEGPTRWTKKYLREHGATALVETFDPEGAKLDRAARFLDRYVGVLREARKWDELESAVRKRYGTDIRGMLEE